MIYALVILGYHMKNFEKRRGAFNFAFRKMKCMLLLGNKILTRVGMHNMYGCVICLSNICMCMNKTIFKTKIGQGKLTIEHVF
jgi:hypothetical protein